MKHTRVFLASWMPRDPEDFIEIDWPFVQRTIGVDHLEWLLAQHKSDCQLVVEREPDSDQHRLVVEFYNSKLEVEYFLRWAQPVSH